MTEGQPETVDVWVLGFQGPRCAVFLREFKEQKKTLVEFHGVPEIVDSAKVYAIKADCYRVAVTEKTQEGMDCIAQAQRWLAEFTEGGTT